MSFAQTSIGLSKDVLTRFNIATTVLTPKGFESGVWPGLFSLRLSHYMPAPKNPQVTITLVNGTEIDLPWYAYALHTYDGYQSFYSDWKSDGGENLVKTKESKTKDHSRTKIPEPFYVRSSGHRSDLSSSTLQPISNSTANGIGMYALDNEILVAYVNNFEPTDYYAFTKVLLEGVLYARFNGISQVILDLTMNGGGDICLGRSVLAFLYGEEHGFKNFEPTDLPSSPLAINMSLYAVNFSVRDTPWSPSFYQGPNGKSFTDASWLIPGVTRVRGGLTRNYSQLVEISSKEDSCGDLGIILSQPLSPTRLLIVNRGFCGSTCALFADTLSTQGVKTLTFFQGTTPPGQQQSYRSFPGLQVLDSDYLYDKMDELGQATGDQSCTDCYAPRRLLTTAAFRLCNREVYKSVDKTDAPLEYTFQPSDFHVGLTREETFDQVLQWEKAKTLLQTDSLWK
eukprot:TRINITY_DN3193_c0_g1_i10.p1 TRINITY_DN3193_c0_g1~~TRINITY_DN3193_c0_g1_i10.p1  ORF type:complete len:454 (-),score=71.46 TRINITY_DN3193_c0_g1_i10:41-1402(-)